MTKALPPGYSIVSIQKGKRFLLLLRGKAVGILPSHLEASRFAEIDANQRKTTMVDKSKLKVYHVPFTTTVMGKISCLATSEEEAIRFLNDKLEDGSLGWDTDNLIEEGVLHDGSVNFAAIATTEITNEGAGATVVTDEKPKEHPDWDAFEAGDDTEAEEVEESVRANDPSAN